MPSDKELVADILQNEEAETIASALGIDAEAFAARVVAFIQNPTTQAATTVTTPEQDQGAHDDGDTAPTASTTSNRPPAGPQRSPGPLRGLK